MNIYNFLSSETILIEDKIAAFFILAVGLFTFSKIAIIMVKNLFLKPSERIDFACITKDEKKLVNQFRKMPVTQQEEFINIIDTMEDD